MNHGAQSLKVTGAGGGGHMFVYATARKHKSIERIMKELGAEKVNFTYQNSGAEVFDINNLYEYEKKGFFFNLTLFRPYLEFPSRPDRINLSLFSMRQFLTPLFSLAKLSKKPSKIGKP